ncbi:MAG: cysteine desulfurase family protein [Bacteroidota bacterium]
MALNYLYFDNAATTAVDPLVVEAMLPYLSEQYGNASATHGPGRMARLAVETARKKIASILHCKPVQIVFTSGGTESANLVIRSMASCPRISHLITSRTEHLCVLQTASIVHESGIVSLDYVALNNDGTVNLMDLNHLLETAPTGTLVCLMHANNEMGAPLNMSLVTEICRRHGAMLFSDSVQTVGHYPFDLSQSSVDFISASAHKFHGPKGVGFLYVKDPSVLRAVTTGGGHESGLRAGTENVAGIVGMAKALELASKRYDADSKHVRLLKSAVREKVLSLGAVVNGCDDDAALYTVLSVGFPKNNITENLLLELDMAGVAASGGSACSAGKSGSHVMEAIGAAERINIRFSFSRNNTLEEVKKLGNILEDILVKIPA